MKPFAQRKAYPILFFVVAVLLLVPGLYVGIVAAAYTPSAPGWIAAIAPMFWMIAVGTPFAAAMIYWGTRRFVYAFFTLALLTAYAGLLASGVTSPASTLPLAYWVAALAVLAVLLRWRNEQAAKQAAKAKAIQDALPKPPPVPTLEQRQEASLVEMREKAQARSDRLREELAVARKQAAAITQVLHQCVDRERVVQREIRDHLALVHGLRGEDLEFAVLKIQRDAGAAFERRYQDPAEVARVQAALFSPA